MSDIFDDIQKAVDEVGAAKQRTVDILKSRWPVGCTILCWLRYGQVTPSEMEVIGYNGNGYVRASMPSKKARFGRFVKNIYFKEIVM